MEYRAAYGQPFLMSSHSRKRIIVAKTPNFHAHTSVWDRPGFLVRRLHQIHVAIFLEEMAEDNITPIQFGLLSALADLPGLDQLSLAEEIGIDRANVADVLTRLESRGLVIRTVSERDNRRKLCVPTQQGLAFVKKHYENMQRAQDRLLRPLQPAERARFMRLLRRVVEASNNLGRAPLRPSAQRGAAVGTSKRPRSHASKRTRG
jgi:DNA-binding MarR family transcriptional regulator